jgi:hypothetical protein
MRSVGREAQPLTSGIRRCLQAESRGKEGALRFLLLLAVFFDVLAGAKGGIFLPIAHDLGLLRSPPTPAI